MKLPIKGQKSAFCVLVALLLISLISSHSNAQGFYQDKDVEPGLHQQAPPMPGALLAGGVAAAQGNQFIDAQGKPIVMPASYCQPTPGGYGAPCPGGYPGGYGDPMAVDFGGYGQDQCGPHYFDIAFDAVFLRNDNSFIEGTGPLGSRGVGAQDTLPTVNPSGQGDEYEAGWRIAARYDIGALAVFEATYMGLYDFGFSDSFVATQPAELNSLHTVFNDFGQDVGNPIPALDQANSHAISFESELQSTELSYRRYWLGNNPRISGTYLLGARYLRLTEDFLFSSDGPIPGPSSLGFATENDLVGFQFGGDIWACLRQGLRIGVESKAGIYNNRYKFQFDNNVAGTTASLPARQSGNQVAYASELGASLVADILPSWSIKGGYQVLYINSLTTIDSNFSTDILDIPTPATPALQTQDDALYHGFHGGLEYVW